MIPGTGPSQPILPNESYAVPTIDKIITLKLRIQEEIDEQCDEIKAALSGIEEISPDQFIGQLSPIGTIELYALAIEAQRRRESRLSFLEAALERIDDGEYDECDACHQDISWARLDAQPEAR